jgi:hypothetical protein
MPLSAISSAKLDCMLRSLSGILRHSILETQTCLPYTAAL